MRKIVDAEPNSTNWTAGSGQTILDSEHPEYIAGAGNTKALLVSFSNVGDYAELDLSASPIDISDYNFLSFTVWSRLGASTNRYKIAVDGSGFAHFDTYSVVTDLSIDVSSISSLNRLRIELDTDLSDTDHLILSYFVLSTPEYPLDIMTGMVDQLVFERDRLLINGGFKAGTLSASSGDSIITIGGLIEYVERYSVIKIEGGGNSETHLLLARDGDEFDLGGLYDGNTILNDYTDADVYVIFEVIFGQAEKEILLPSVVLWGFEPIPVQRDNPNELIPFSKTGSDWSLLEQGMLLDFPMQIDLMARHYEEIAKMATFVRSFFRHRHFWINGRDHSFIATDPSTEITPETPEVQIYHVTYNVSIEVREAGEITVQPEAKAATITSSIEG